MTIKLTFTILVPPPLTPLHPLHPSHAGHRYLHAPSSPPPQETTMPPIATQPP